MDTMNNSQAAYLETVTCPIIRELLLEQLAEAKAAGELDMVTWAVAHYGDMDSVVQMVGEWSEWLEYAYRTMRSDFGYEDSVFSAESTERLRAAVAAY